MIIKKQKKKKKKKKPEKDFYQKIINMKMK